MNKSPKERANEGAMKPTDAMREVGSEGKRVGWAVGGKDKWRDGRWEIGNRCTEGGTGEGRDRGREERRNNEVRNSRRYAWRKGERERSND